MIARNGKIRRSILRRTFRAVSSSTAAIVNALAARSPASSLMSNSAALVSRAAAKDSGSVGFSEAILNRVCGLLYCNTIEDLDYVQWLGGVASSSSRRTDCKVWIVTEKLSRYHSRPAVLGLEGVGSGSGPKTPSKQLDEIGDFRLITKIRETTHYLFESHSLGKPQVSPGALS